MARHSYAIPMGHYPYTAFNAATLAAAALAILIVAWRFRGPLRSNWPLVFHAAILGHALGFAYGLNPYVVFAGLACAVAIRFGIAPARIRFVELLPLAYVVYRCVSLILMW